MKKLIIVMLMLGGVAVAQPPSAIPTGLGGPAYQSAVNAWLQYLYTNKPQGLSASIDSELVIFSGTGGKTIKRASLTGIPYLTSGVLGAATSTHIISLFGSGSCSGYLKSDGTCDTPSGGISSLNGLSGATQTFAKSDDTNVTITITSTGTGHTFSLSWQSTLAISRGGTGAATTSQNFAFIGPTSGSGAPSFRALVEGDIPTIPQSKVTNLESDLATKASSDAATTVNGQTCTLGSTCTVTASLPSNPTGCTGGQFVADIAADGTLTCSTPSGGGDFVGPASSTNNNLAAFDGTTGKLGKDSGLSTANASDAITKKHTQHTDTGTTQTTFQIDSGNSGPKLKNNAGVLEARNAADDDYADFRAKTISAGDGTVAGEAVMNELLVNGTNYISWLVPDAITSTLRLKFPNANPAGSVLSCGTPSSSVSTCTWVAGTVTVASGAKALDTDAIASEACDTMTATATGAASTDTVTWTPNADITAVTGYAPVTTGGLSIYMWPTTDTLNIKVCNPTSSSITPGAVTLNWRIVR